MGIVSLHFSIVAAQNLFLLLCVSVISKCVYCFEGFFTVRVFHFYFSSILIINVKENLEGLKDKNKQKSGAFN